MDAKLKSVLCQETWRWDSRDEKTIRFNGDGTGEVHHHHLKH